MAGIVPQSNFLEVLSAGIMTQSYFLEVLDGRDRDAKLFLGGFGRQGS